VALNTIALTIDLFPKYNIKERVNVKEYDNEKVRKR
jgi:hypothetical protein